MGIKQIIIKKTQCNIALNRKALCWKKSWDEVAKLLDELCPACPEKKKKCHK